MAESQSGLSISSASGAQAGGSTWRRTASPLSERVVKKAAHEGSTDVGSTAHFACIASTNSALAPKRKEVSARTSFSRPASSAISKESRLARRPFARADHQIVTPEWIFDEPLTRAR